VNVSKKIAPVAITIDKGGAVIGKFAQHNVGLAYACAGE
jgi:hypothetical protein